VFELIGFGMGGRWLGFVWKEMVWFGGAQVVTRSLQFYRHHRPQLKLAPERKSAILKFRPITQWRNCRPKLIHYVLTIRNVVLNETLKQEQIYPREHGISCLFAGVEKF